MTTERKGRRPRFQKFTGGIQEMALRRQQGLCACCGTPITRIGEAGRLQHQFHEGAHAHHVKHVKLGGSNELDNCAVICESCHYSVHEGGNYRFGTVAGTPSDFEFFFGATGSAIEC